MNAFLLLLKHSAPRKWEYSLEYFVVERNLLLHIRYDMLLALSHFSLDCLTASQVITLLETSEAMLLELVAVICLKIKRIKQEIRRLV